MAFATLFTRLSAVDEDFQSSSSTAFAHSRHETEDGKRGRKRKTQGEQRGTYKKTQHYQTHTNRTDNAARDDSKAVHYHMQCSYSERAVKRGHCHSNMSRRGQNYRPKNNSHVNLQQEQKKKTEGQWDQQRGRGRYACRGGRSTFRRGGGDRTHRNDKQDLEVKRDRFMSQEFKDQNALLVDGRLLCRHFLLGRCIKGDDCQLEHIQPYNNLLKELCKFYVQGFCTNGESCPYMHKSFPCKFFHRNGQCCQGTDCRFSHEPLNDVTSRLLDEALKRDSDLNERAKKAEQESSGQPVNADESEITDANKTPDILLQPRRPNFYTNTDTDAEKEVLQHQTEEPAHNVEESVPSRASDTAQPHSPPLTNLDHKEPVCYSVEAVLGPQLSKPFPSFFTSQDSAPLSSSDGSSGCADQSQVSYSVDAVLRSYKSVENSTCAHAPSPPTAQIVSYNPKTDLKEITHPPLSSETQDEKVLCSVNSKNEANKSQEKMYKSLSSLQEHTGPISKICPNLAPASGDHKIQCGSMPALKPAQRASHEAQSEVLHSPVTVAKKSASCKSKGDMKGSTHLPLDITRSVNCTGVLPFGPKKRNSISSSQTSTPERPTQLKPHPSVLTSDSQASFKPFCPSAGFTEFKGRAALPAGPVTSTITSSDSVRRHFEAKQPAEIRQRSKNTQSGLKLGTKQHYSTAECSSKVAHCGGLALGCNKTLEKPFHSLFASPVTDTLQPIDDSVTSPSCPPGLIQSSHPAPESTDCRSDHPETALQPDKPSAKPFLSLFASPLRCMQSQPRDSGTFSCSQQSVQSVGDPSRNEGKLISQASRLPDVSSNPIRGNDGSSVKQPAKHVMNPICRLVSDPLSERATSPTACSNSTSATHAHQLLPDISSRKASVAEAGANSVLKTLFLCLSPYQSDGEQQDSVQISVPSESDKKDTGSAGGVSVKEQWKSKKECRREKKLKPQQSTEKTVTHSAEHQLSPQTPQVSLEATGGSTVSRGGLTEPQVRDSGTHKSPFRPVAPLMQHHTRPRLEQTSEERRTSATSLKDLFKTLDTTVFDLRR